jgi:branched-chain amino acid transport system permease protein
LGAIEYFIQLLLGGLSTGFIYSLVGLGFVIIFKSTKVLNLAQGEMMMLGAYITLSFQKLLGLPFLPAFLLALGAAYFLGMTMERIFLRKMIGEPIFSVVMLTVGLGVSLRGLVGLIWTQEEQIMTVPLFSKILKISNISISYGNLIVIFLSLALVLGFTLFYKYSKIGIAMRATASNQDSAMIMGIDVQKVFSRSWSYSAVVSVFGGIVLAGITIITPNMANFGLKALPAIVLGGIDSIIGVILGGIIVGVSENIVGGYLGGVAQQLTPHLILFIVLVFKPYGLFGTKEIERV